MNTSKTKAIAELKSDLFLFDLGLPIDANETCGYSDYNKVVNDAVCSLRPFISKSKETSICIIVDDYTRTTPTAKILSFLMPALGKEGIDKKNVFFLFASGSHSLMNDEEKRARLSDEVFENYRSMDHHFFDNDHLLKMKQIE